MGSITSIAEFFLLSVAFGVGLFSFLADSKETGAGFLKLVSSIGFTCIGLALALHLSEESPSKPMAALYIVAFLSFLAIYFFHGEKKSLVMWLLYGSQNIACALVLYFFMSFKTIPYFFAATSVALLGVITYLMVMGHWYLVTPKLSVRPLDIGIKICWVVLVLKILWSTTNSFENAHYFSAGTTKAGGYAFNWMMLLMRYLWGYVVIGVMSFYTWRLIKIRSTQSATGILYAMTFFVFVGELISIYLHFTYGLFI